MRQYTLNRAKCKGLQHSRILSDKRLSAILNTCYRLVFSSKSSQTLSMFLDIGLGILSAIFISESFDVSISPWLILTGIFFALLPDIDFLIHIFQKKSPHHNAYEHRSLLHLPLLYIPLGAIVLWLLFGSVWAGLFSLASFLHFIHDSFGIGRGVHWLFPFSQNSFAFFYMHSRKVKQGLWQWIFVFNKETTAQFDKEHGDDDWIKNIYRSWHPFALLEYIGFILSIIILIYALR